MRLKNICYTLLASIFIGCALTSCGNADEREQPYTGPWIIIYSESYYRIHNNSDEFHAWFDAHLPYVTYAQFETSKGTLVYENEEIYWEDYSNTISGGVCWEQLVNDATEEEMQAMSDEFSSFTIRDDKNREYDKFTGSYYKYNN